MIKTASSFTLVAATILALPACGGCGSGDKSAADAQLSSIESAVAQASAAVGSLDPSDAIAVARADQLDNAQTASSVYTLNSSACRFDISDTAAEGTALFQVEVGSHIQYYNYGTKGPGLGDEAYTNSNGGTVVRVGGLLITAGDDSFDSKMTLDLLTTTVPNLH